MLGVHIPIIAIVIKQPIAALDPRGRWRNRELRRAWRFGHTGTLERYKEASS